MSEYIFQNPDKPIDRRLFLRIVGGIRKHGDATFCREDVFDYKYTLDVLGLKTTLIINHGSGLFINAIIYADHDRWYLPAIISFLGALPLDTSKIPLDKVSYDYRTNGFKGNEDVMLHDLAILAMALD